MALYGVVSGYIQGREYRIEWSATQSQEGNYSDLTFRHFLVNNPGYDLYIGSRENWVAIDGAWTSWESGAISTGGGSTIDLGTTWHRVYHNADGSKSIAIVGDFYVQAWLSGSYVEAITASGQIELDKIARGAILTAAPNFTDEGAPQISYQNTAGSIVSSITATIEKTNGTALATRMIPTTSGNYTFTFTASERSAMQAYCTGKSATVVFKLTTTRTDSSKFYSTLSKTLTIANAEPTLSPTVTDTNSATIALSGSSARVVYGESVLAYAFNATAKKGATITAYSLVYGNRTFATATGTIDNPQAAVFTFSVTDSRGYTTTQEIRPQVAAYTLPTCALSADMPTTAGDCSLTITGTYAAVNFGAYINAVTAVQYRMKEESGNWGAWINLGVLGAGSGRVSQQYTVTGLDYQKQYTFQARLADRLATVESETRTVKTTPVFDWGENDFSVNVLSRFRAGANVGGRLYCASGASFQTHANAHATLNGSVALNGAVTIGGEALSDYVIETGTSGVWTYRKWHSGRAELWGRWTNSVAPYASAGGLNYYRSGFKAHPFELSNIVYNFSGFISNQVMISAGVDSASSRTQTQLLAASTYGSLAGVTFTAYLCGNWK